MAFTDRQELLWDNLEDLRLRKRTDPLDGHPQEWSAKHYIIKLTTPLGADFYLWSPGADVIWTEDKTGAYRYSDTDMGLYARDADMRAGDESRVERGVDGKITFETINQ